MCCSLCCSLHYSVLHSALSGLCSVHDSALICSLHSFAHVRTLLSALCLRDEAECAANLSGNTFDRWQCFMQHLYDGACAIWLPSHKALDFGSSANDGYSPTQPSREQSSAESSAESRVRHSAASSAESRKCRHGAESREQRSAE